MLLASYFELPVEIEQYVGHWLPLCERDQSRLGRCQVGVNAVLGRRVWDRQSKFRITIGPMSLAQYQDFLPGSSTLQRLADWVALYSNGELAWDVRLKLQHDAVPPLELGRGTRLGWTSWLGRRPGSRDADDLVLDAERLLARPA